MSDHPTSLLPTSSRRISPVFWGVCLAWILAAVATLWLALSWLERPFPGFLVQENLHVSTFNMAEWPSVQAGVQSWSHLVAVEGRTVTTSTALYEVASQHPLGTPLRYTFEGKDGTRSDITVAVGRYSTWDWCRLFVPFWLGGVLHLIVGGLVVYLRPDNRAARAHWLYCQAMALFLILKFDANSTHVLPKISYLAFGPLVPGIVGLALIFPARLGTVRFRHVTMAAAWGLAAIGMGLVLTTFHDAHRWPSVARMLIAVPSLFYLGAIALWGWEALSKKIQPIERSQARVVMLGMALAFLPPIAYYTLIFMGMKSGGLRLGDLTMAFFPVMVGYAIVRHRAFDIQAVVRRATLYLGMTAGLGVLYVSCVGLGVTLTGGRGGIEAHDLIAALLVATAFHPLLTFLRHRVDRLFLGERADVVDTIATFSRRRSATVSQVSQDLMDLLQQAFRPRWALLTVPGAPPTRAGDVPPELPGALPGPPGTGVRPLPEAWPQAPELGLSITLEFGGEPQGTLLLGPAANEMPYTGSDLAVLTVLAHQAGAALQNARLFENQVALVAQESLARGLAEARQAVLKQVVHDIRSDLFNIQLVAHRLSTRPDLERPAGSLQRSLARIDALLGEKTEHLQAGRPETCHTALAEALEAAASAIAPSLETRSQHLDIHDYAPGAVLGATEVECHQVLLNLLTNAHKFSPAGSTIRLEARLEEGTVVIAVQDEGPGLPSALLEDPTRGRRANDAVPGSGFGLGNTRALLEEVGGTLRWHNLERGCRFEACWPRVAEPV